MRTALFSFGVLLGAAAGACDGGGEDCDCAEVGCFADTCTKKVFVLAAAVSADFGGIAGADQLCAQQAAAAKLSGTFYAWLSDSSRGPFDRFSKSEVPYVLADGTKIAEDWEGLRVNGPLTPIDMSAAGMRLADADDTRVWTGTGPDGRSENFNGASNFCTGWTRKVIEDFTYVGLLRERDTADSWTQGEFPTCTGKGLLYCFQQ
jgi:hypothetical protein